MRFPDIKKIILFGGGNVLARFAKFLIENKDYELVVFSSKRHLEENLTYYNKLLSQFLSENNIKFYDSPDINIDIELVGEVSKNTIGIAFGAAWCFEKKVVSYFSNNCLLDHMGIDLPRYRGGAHYTWQILNNNYKGCSNLQIIIGGKEQFHKGPIIKKKEFQIPEDLKTPLDFFNYIGDIEYSFFVELISEIEQLHNFNIIKLNEEQSTFYPFLSTYYNGLIDWKWNGIEIARFINAFDDPYFGASTLYYDKKVFLKGCEVLSAEEDYHPFSSGLIIRNDEIFIYIATKGALLKIRDVLDESGNKLSIKIGERLYTPSHLLDGAMYYKAIYNSEGLKKGD